MQTPTRSGPHVLNSGNSAINYFSLAEDTINSIGSTFTVLHSNCTAWEQTESDVRYTEESVIAHQFESIQVMNRMFVNRGQFRSAHSAFVGLGLSCGQSNGGNPSVVLEASSFESVDEQCTEGHGGVDHYVSRMVLLHDCRRQLHCARVFVDIQKPAHGRLQKPWRCCSQHRCTDDHGVDIRKLRLDASACDGDGGPPCVWLWLRVLSE